jgi:predicted metal-binding protein
MGDALHSRRMNMNSQTHSLKDFEELFHKHGFTDYKWIDPSAIVVSNWVRMKCMYGCPSYGARATCPPNTPSVLECRAFFDEYTDIAIFRFEVYVDKPEDRHDAISIISKKLLELEKEIFLSNCVKVFALFADSCHFCKECAGSREDCKQPKLARPPPEAFAVDVFSSVRSISYSINVLKDYSETMNRYAFLLIR